MIKLNKLSKSYYNGDVEVEILKDLNLHIKEGEFVSIMGASGSGKSTLLNIIGLLDCFKSGEYYLNNTQIKNNIDDKTASIYRREFIGFIFQSYNLIHYKNVLDNVSLPLLYTNYSRNYIKEKAKYYLSKVNMDKYLYYNINNLSGGQKQRVAIARALINNPKLILADEPTGALDSKNSTQVVNLLQSINQEGKTIVMITHEYEIAAMATRILKIKDGIIYKS